MNSTLHGKEIDVPVGFMHEGLGNAARSAPMLTLRQAAAKIGAVDPIRTLSYVDCDPPEITMAALHLDDAGTYLDEEGKTEFDLAVSIALRSWDGPAAEEFEAAARRVRLDLVRAIDQLDTTGEIGRLQVAKGLDELAHSTAKIAGGIAASAYNAAVNVSTGGASPQDTAKVAEACLAIAETVQRHVEEIPDLGRGL